MSTTAILSTLFLCAIIIGTASLMPGTWIFRKEILNFPEVIWLLAMLSGIFQALYMSALAGAYRNGNISIYYRVARSLPIIFVAILFPHLGKGGEMTNNCFLGIVLISTGTIILPMEYFG